MNRVSAKIDELIRAEEQHPERLVSFFARVQSNYDEAIRTASGFFISMLAAWFLTYAIYAGLIEKVAFLGFELNRKMIVVSPFLVGILSYGLLSALAGAVVLWAAVSRGIFNTLRTAWTYSLDDLLAPPTFSNVERMLEPGPEKRWQSLFSRGWFLLVTLMMFGGSLAALGHTTCLLQSPLGYSPGFGGRECALGSDSVVSRCCSVQIRNRRDRWIQFWTPPRKRESGRGRNAIN